MNIAFKKFTAVFLALVIMLSMLTATTVNAETDDETDYTFYFKVSDFTELTSPENANFYCHIESVYGTDNDFKAFELYSDEENCEYNADTGLVSYDISNLELEDNAIYSVMFIAVDLLSTPAGLYSTNCLEFGMNCIGNTVRATIDYENVTEETVLYGYTVYWDNEELAQDYEDTFMIGDSNIYYSFPYYWGITPGLDDTKVYCHIYNLNDSDPDFVSKAYMSKAENCTYNEKVGAYAYDLISNFEETPLKDDAQYAVTFTVVSGEDMFTTAPLELTTSCINDTAVAVDDTTLAPSDSTKAVYTTYWTGNANFEHHKPLALKENDTNIYVEYPEFLYEKYRFSPNDITTYCHIESVDDPDFVPLERKSTEETCAVIRNDLLAFNAGKIFEGSLKEGKTYKVTIYFDPSGPIDDVVTYPLTMGAECLGDTVYPVDNGDIYLYDNEYKTFWTKEANAEKYGPFEDTNIYYKIPDFFIDEYGAIPGTAKVSCHIYPLNGTDPEFKSYGYMTKDEQCTYNEETGLYSYNLAEKFAETPLKDGAVYGVKFTVAPSGPYPNLLGADLTMTTQCFGDTAYAVDNTDSAPQDSPSGAFNTYWTKNTKYCPVEKFGDIDNNGDINILDATYAQMTVAKYKVDTDVNLSYADMNFDGIIAINDATTIQMKVLKLF